MDRQYIIYKVYCTKTGGIYIGQTCETLEQRKGKHISKATTYFPRNISKFHIAIRTYGPDKFQWEVIEKVDGRDIANERERYWIEIFQSNKPQYGYNMKGGNW